MVAYHIMNGISVPLDATDFYRGLDEKFMKRDGMYFLADQVNEYLFPFEYKMEKETLFEDGRFAMNNFGGELSISLND